MKDLLTAMNVIGDEEESNWDVDDQYEEIKKRAFNSQDTISQVITQQIENPTEENTGQQTSVGSGFDAESFFAIGKTLPNPNENPFSTESLQQIEQKLKTTENTEGEAHSVPTAMLDSVSDEELAKFRETASTVVEEPKTTNAPFEVVSEPAQPTTQISVETAESDSEPVPVVTGNETQVLKQEEQTQQPNHLQQLASVAEVKDPNEIAEMVNPNKTNVVSVDSASNPIIVDEEEVDEADEMIIDQADVNSYVSEIVDMNETTSVGNDSLNQHQGQPTNPTIIVEEEEEESLQQQPSYQTQQPSLTEPTISIYESKFGPKYRGTTAMVNNGHILDLSNFNDKEYLTGDVYIARVNLATYGQYNAKRVDYEFILMDKARVRGAQFNVPPQITQQELDPLVGQVVTIEGKWNLYNNSKQINVDKMEISTRTSPDLFTVTDAEQLDSWLDLFISELNTDWIRELVTSIYYNDDTLTRMKNTPAALSNHDTGQDGLFLHTMKVTMNAYQASKIYPTVNTEVVIASSLLHDIGKIWEIGENSYTEFGVAIGHISIGYSIVRDRLNDLANNGFQLDNRVANNILHCILAHHGKLEYGSPVEPKTREAWIVHFCDSMDTFVTHMDEQLVGGEKQVFSRMTRGSLLDLN